MREILEEAVITYRQEAENLLFLAAPAVVIGPLLILVSAAGLTPELVCVPLLLALYLATYAAAVRAAGRVVNNMEPDPIASFLGAAMRTLRVIQVAAPGGLLLGGVWWCAIFLSDLGFDPASLLIGLGGTIAAFVWATRHVYDLPLVLVHDASANEAMSLGPQLADPNQTTAFTATIASPLVAAGLLSLLLGLAKPVFGGVVFAAAAGLWLPFAAMALTFSCDRLVSEALAQTDGRQRAAS